MGVVGVELRGLPTWDNRFGQYGIKVSFWGSGTLKIVIYVENHHHNRPPLRLDDYHPLGGGWGGQSADNIYIRIIHVQ